MNRAALDCSLLVLSILATRIPFRSEYLYHQDSVNFALALERFDPSLDQPHFPGYFLYVMAGRVALLLFRDANTALVALSIVASCGFVVMVYALTRQWFERRAAILAGCACVISPLFWFHGTVALVYSVEAFFAAAVGYLGWKVYCGNPRYLVPSAVAFAMAVGIRQSSALFLGPLWLFSLAGVRGRDRIIGLAVWAITCTAWFLAMLRVIGMDAAAYLGNLFSLWQRVLGTYTVFSNSLLEPLNLTAGRLAAVILGLTLCFGALTFVSLWPTSKPHSHSIHEIKRFCWVWLTPGLLFFTLGFFRFVNSGYLFVLVPPLFAFAGAKLAAKAVPLKGAVWKPLAIFAVCGVINTGLFLYAPVYSSYQAVRRFEKTLANVVQHAQQHREVEIQVIVGFDLHFMSYRHFGYYLPEFTTVLYPPVDLPEGSKVMTLRGRQTVKLSELALRDGDRFLIGIPPGAEYSKLLDVVSRLFPEGVLFPVGPKDQSYLAGQARDLGTVFPVQVLTAQSPVYGGTRK